MPRRSNGKIGQSIVSVGVKNRKSTNQVKWMKFAGQTEICGRQILLERNTSFDIHYN